MDLEKPAVQFLNVLYTNIKLFMNMENSKKGKALIKTKLREFLSEKKYKITEVKYFSPDGRKAIPNGHPIQKGGFIKECIENSKKFKTNNHQYFINENFDIIEAIHSNQYGLSDYRGGIIIFSTDINSLNINKNQFINWLQQKGKTLFNRFFSKSKLNKVVNKFNVDNPDSPKKLGSDVIDDYIGAFSIGNFFSGRYIGDNNKVFDEKSLSIEVNGISSKGLIYLAEEIAREFNQETVLVKDLNINKIFLVNQLKGDNYDLSDLNKKSI